MLEPKLQGIFDFWVKSLPLDICFRWRMETEKNTFPTCYLISSDHFYPLLILGTAGLGAGYDH